jgi:hypothetical protein
MGLFDGFNPFDPLGIAGGGGAPGTGGDDGSSGGGGLAIIGGGGPNQEQIDKANEFDQKKAYGTFGGGDSQFNQMRKQQLGMGRQGD